jgi:hypothetical protein
MLASHLAVGLVLALDPHDIGPGFLVMMHHHANPLPLSFPSDPLIDFNAIMPDTRAIAEPSPPSQTIEKMNPRESNLLTRTCCSRLSGIADIT